MRKRGRPCLAPLIHLRRPRASIIRGDYVDYEFECENQLDLGSNEPYEIQFNNESPLEMPYNSLEPGLMDNDHTNVYGNQTNFQWNLSCDPSSAVYSESTVIVAPSYTTLQSFTGNFIAANDPTFNTNFNMMFHSEDSSSSTASTASTSSNASNNSTNANTAITATTTTTGNILIVNSKKRGRGKALTEEEKIQRKEDILENKRAKVQAKLQKKNK